jgi:hypothetical protein
MRDQTLLSLCVRRITHIVALPSSYSYRTSRKSFIIAGVLTMSVVSLVLAVFSAIALCLTALSGPSAGSSEVRLRSTARQG